YSEVSSMASNNEVFPKVEPKEDKLYRVAEAAFSFFPAGLVVLQSLITPPIQKRTEKWINETERRLSALENSGEINVAALIENEAFSALVLKCIQAVATTSQEEKLNYLRNFVISIAKLPNFEEDEVYILFGILNEFTPSHIMAVNFYSYPNLYSDKISKLSSTAPKASQPQGGELAQVFGGDPEYWQSIYSTASGKFVVSFQTVLVQCNETTKKKISGKGTELGFKLLKLISD
ncbi:hypothetical protein ACSG4G_004665, partial [Vibrio parahaemolyticus]